MYICIVIQHNIITIFCTEQAMEYTTHYLDLLLLTFVLIRSLFLMEILIIILWIYHEKLLWRNQAIMKKREV